MEFVRVVEIDWEVLAVSMRVVEIVVALRAVEVVVAKVVVRVVLVVKVVEVVWVMKVVSGVEVQDGKTFCASICASLIVGSRREFSVCSVLTVFVCCWSSE